MWPPHPPHSLINPTPLCSYGIVLKKFIGSKHPTNSLTFSVLRDSFCFPVLLVAALLIEGRMSVQAGGPRFLYPTLRELPLFIVLGLTGMLVGCWGGGRCLCAGAWPWRSDLPTSSSKSNLQITTGQSGVFTAQLKAPAAEKRIWEKAR